MTCPKCQAMLRVEADTAGRTALCPQCNAEFQVPQVAAVEPPAEPPVVAVAAAGSPTKSPEIQQAASTKITAGLCGILLGWLGIHKFILGRTTEGVIMLLVSVLSCSTLAIVMSVIGIVEGIIYLTKTDEEFYQVYVVDEKGWF